LDYKQPTFLKRTEIYALLAFAYEIQMNARLEKYISICCDRQAALKAP